MNRRLPSLLGAGLLTLAATRMLAIVMGVRLRHGAFSDPFRCSPEY